MKTFQEMEDQFYHDAREELLRGLLTRPAAQRLLFNRMYAHEHLDWSPETTVANMSRDKLSWAMHQVKAAIDGEAS